MPTAANLVAKVAMSMLFAIGASGGMMAVALLACTTTLSITAMLAIWGVMVAGTIPFCAIVFIGSLVSGSAAPAYGNLLFLPMMWLSGIFMPPPALLRSWVVLWPSFHLYQVPVAAGGIDDFVFVPTQMAIAALLGVTVLFGGLAVRRLARVG